MKKNEHQAWEHYRETELAFLGPHLRALGYELDTVQPHVGGERFLMQAVTTTSGRKLILLGTRSKDGKRVVIKSTDDAGGIREIQHERICRTRLKDIKFAYRIFLTPEELFYEKKNGRVISIQAFIEQQKPFLARPTPEQFTLALSAFKAQESAHAATYEQARMIARTFGEMRAADYIHRFKQFKADIESREANPSLGATLARAFDMLKAEQETIEQYAGFLTHTDFVPHNIRVVGSDMYLLDHSSLRFGNKYEGWARFINFMTLYNPPLAEALTEYVAKNRAPEESRALHSMRIYRLGEIISYYVRTLDKSEGDLLALNRLRINFWKAVLDAVLTGAHVPHSLITEYQNKRDALRSPEENVRQQGLH